MEGQHQEVIDKRRKSHIRLCSVNGCTSKGYRLLVAGERIQYFPFPLKNIDHCQRWATALQLPSDTPFEKSFVCSKHFTTRDYKQLKPGRKRSLRRAAVPTLEPPMEYRRSPPVQDPESTDSDVEDPACKKSRMIPQELPYGNYILPHSVAEVQKDDFDAFGHFIAQSLRQLPLKHALNGQIKIQLLLTKLRLGCVASDAQPCQDLSPSSATVSKPPVWSPPPKHLPSSSKNAVLVGRLDADGNMVWSEPDPDT